MNDTARTKIGRHLRSIRLEKKLSYYAVSKATGPASLRPASAILR